MADSSNGKTGGQFQDPGTIPFRTTPEQLATLPSIATELRAALPAAPWVEDVVALARFDQGIFDLMEMWRDAATPKEREYVLADLQRGVEDYRVTEGTYRGHA